MLTCWLAVPSTEHKSLAYQLASAILGFAGLEQLTNKLTCDSCLSC